MRVGSVWIHKNSKAIIKITSKNRFEWEGGSYSNLDGTAEENILAYWEEVPKELEKESYETIRLWYEL